MARPTTLPGYRPKKPKSSVPQKFSTRLVLTWTAAAVTVLFILLNLLVRSPKSETRPKDGSEIFRSRTGNAEAWPQLGDKLEGGTDKYIPTREGEILGNWDPRFGLEIDTWDPRTHDPRSDPDRYGAPVKIKKQEEKHYLSAMIFNRVFKADKFNITLYEIRQWLEYVRYAGVGHVFWYDTAHSPEESQERGLRPYVKQGFLTYHHFHHMYSGNLDAGYHFEQDQSELHCINEYGASTKWLLVMDVDEYVFMPRDQTPGFLERYLRLYEADYPDVSQLLLQCMPFLGHPQKRLPDLLIERYQLRKAETEGVSLGPAAKMKAVLKPASCHRVYRHDPHHFEMKSGKTVALPAGVMRLNHYQGPRATNYGPDTPELLASLVEDKTIQPIADELRKILHVKKGVGISRR